MNPDPDVYEIRRRQLRRLIDERFKGVVAHAAEALGMRAPQLHRWLSTKGEIRRLEYDSARKIEARLHLAPMWLDAETDVPVRQFVPLSAVRLAVRYVREAEARAGVRYTDADFTALVELVADWAAELNDQINADDARRFRVMLDKIAASNLVQPAEP